GDARGADPGKRRAREHRLLVETDLAAKVDRDAREDVVPHRAVVSERALEPAVATLLQVGRVDGVVHVTQGVDVAPPDLDALLAGQYARPSRRSMVASVRRRMRRSCRTTSRAGRVASSSTYARSRFSYCTSRPFDTCAGPVHPAVTRSR